MRSVIISSALLLILIIAISINAYYINSVSTEMLDLTFALPSEYGYLNSLEEKDIEKYKTEINKLAAKWEKNSFKISFVTKYSDFERINTALYSLKEYFFAGKYADFERGNSAVYSLKGYFFAGYYADYATARKRLIAALEKQKQNELPILENIF